MAILVVIYTETNYYNRSFILQVLCITVAIIHGSIFPYKEAFANVLDLIILLITVFAVSFNSGYSFTTFYSSQSFDVLLVGIVIAPLVCFLVFVICLKTSRFVANVVVEDIASIYNLSMMMMMIHVMMSCHVMMGKRMVFWYEVQ